MQKSDMLNLDQEDLWHFENNNTIDPVDRVGPRRGQGVGTPDVVSAERTSLRAACAM